MLGGVLVGIAAALRFSEAVFVAPAVGMLMLERRWRDAVVCLVAAAGTALAIQAISDQLYWGTPFYSLRHAIDYTLVERQSTRGFQPPWHYLTTMPEWSNVAIVAVAVFAAIRGGWRPALWAGVPLIALSVLPHKEARYLIPIVPFVSVLAGAGLWRLIVRASSPGAMPPWSSIAIVGGVVASTLLSINGYHVRRSDAAVSLARAIASTPGVSSVAVEQLWRWGGRIYLGGVPALQELDGRLARPEDLTALAQVGSSGSPGSTGRRFRSSRCEPKHAPGWDAWKPFDAPDSRSVYPLRVRTRSTESSRVRLLASTKAPNTNADKCQGPGGQSPGVMESYR